MDEDVDTGQTHGAGTGDGGMSRRTMIRRG